MRPDLRSVASLRGALEETRTAIARPREHIEAAARAAGLGGRSIAAALLPLSICAALVVALAPTGTSAAPYALFVCATLPAACLAIKALGALFGVPIRYGDVVLAWGPSYWATDLLLATLATTHLGARALGLEPSELPAIAAFAMLVLGCCAGLWKLFYALGTLRYALGLRGWRLAAGSAILLALALGHALVSATAFGAKLPIL